MNTGTFVASIAQLEEVAGQVEDGNIRFYNHMVANPLGFYTMTVDIYVTIAEELGVDYQVTYDDGRVVTKIH